MANRVAQGQRSMKTLHEATKVDRGYYTDLLRADHIMAGAITWDRLATREIRVEDLWLRITDEEWNRYRGDPLTHPVYAEIIGMWRDRYGNIPYDITTERHRNRHETIIRMRPARNQYNWRIPTPTLPTYYGTTPDPDTIP